MSYLCFYPFIGTFNGVEHPQTNFLLSCNVTPATSMPYFPSLEDNK